MSPRSTRREAGFTLIELMVVVLIIGILIAIALPTFLGARNRASDKVAESDMRTALAAALSFYTVGATFTGYDAAAATTAEPELVWLDATQPDLSQIDIQVASGPNLLLVAKSRSKTFFCLAQQAGNPLTTRGSNTDFTQVDTVAECTGGW